MNKIEKMFYETLINVLNSSLSRVYTNSDYQEWSYLFKKEKFEENCFQLDVKDDKNMIITSILLTIETNNSELNIAGYIPDILISIDASEIGYAIEIDGYEWHEKTKEQAINDRRKDRAYLKNGYVPIRFLGSEVYHNALNTVIEMIEIIISNELSLRARSDYEYMEYQLWCIKNETEEK